jgi:CDP-diacylglycerol--glycerol-3-phosphate 3-phosphatidyltransferase
MSVPTQLTVLRILLVPVFYILFVSVNPPMLGWAALAFLFAAVSDWWDGEIARRYNLTTSLGAFLDPLADKLLTGVAFIAFAMKGYAPWWMVWLVLSRDVYLTLLRLVGDAMGLPVKTSYLAKVKTFVQMTFIVLLLTALLSQAGDLGQTLKPLGETLIDSDLLFWSMFGVTTLTVLSAVQYSWDNWAVVRTIALRYVLRRSAQESV